MIAVENLIGYLIAVAAFAVGFMSVRIHGNADRQREMAVSASWRIRERLDQGLDVEISEIPVILRALTASRDVVTELTLWTDRLLLVGTTCLAAGSLLTGSWSEGDPPQASLLLLLMIVGQVLVTLIGEVDVRVTRRSLRVTLEQTVVGRSEAVLMAIDREDWIMAQRLLEDLSRELPRWRTLEELEALVLYKSGAIARSMALLHRSVRAGTATSLGLHVWVADCLSEGATERASEAVATFRAQRGPSVPNRSADDIDVLVSFVNGDLKTIIEPPPSESPIDETGSSGRAAPWDDDGLWAQSQLGLIGARSGARAHIGSVAYFTELSYASGLLRWWHGLGERPASIERPGWPIDEVLSWLEDAARAGTAGLSSERVYVATISAGSIELIENGLFVLLSIGAFPQAVEVAERGLINHPTRALLHWCLFAAYTRVGWEQAAATSLRRAEVLMPRDPALDFSRRPFNPVPSGTTGWWLNSRLLGSPRLAALAFRILVAERDRVGGEEVGRRPAREAFFGMLAGASAEGERAA